MIFLDRLDLKLVAASFALIFFSLLILLSSGGELFNRQLIWLIPALFFIVYLPQFNLKAILTYRWIRWSLYLGVLVLLFATFLIAPTIGGAKSWIRLGGFQIQPSEFMKAAMIVFLSGFFALRHIAIARLGIILASFVYMIVPFTLILIQPDLGTALIIFAIWFGYLLVSGIQKKHLLAAFLILMIVIAIGWGFLLADYQKARIAGLFSPELDPLGINYNVIQSKIAIGSGGLLGKGFGQGTQVHLGFLPAAHTDFVFSAFVEEWGLIGGAVLIAIFMYLVHRIILLGKESDNNFARLVALGTALMLIIHFIINFGSATGILPVIGVGLPLVSYGGSNLLTVTFLLGIVQAISNRKVLT